MLPQEKFLSRGFCEINTKIFSINILTGIIKSDIINL